MGNTNIKAIPYGVSDYGLIREENDYYVDKTHYLPDIEKCGRYLFFIRPRRFGKSLFLSMMKSYYDLLYKDRFEKLFKGTWIYDHPTGEHGKYLVLSLNFSQVETVGDNIEASFLIHVRDLAVDFIRRYNDLLSANSKLKYYSRNIESGTSAADIFSSLMVLARGANQSLYVIIDEYDNFANTVLTTSGKSAYHALTQGEGILRSFFNIVKGGATGNEAPIKRLFITGVSPVTMDDVTSGFNIGENISLDLDFNQMLGFNTADVAGMIDYYRRAGKITHTTDELKDVMSQWYGNYRFSADAEISLFNSDMVLYFLKNYMKQQKLPKNLIDRNVRIDYGKLRHLIILDQSKGETPATNGNFSKLKQIIEEGGTTSKIVDSFSLEEMTHADNFKSLLYYFGLLTIKEVDLGETFLTVPNETVRRLFYDYIKSAYEETGMFSLDLSKYGGLMNAMASKGEWEPLIQYITGRMKESMSLRDLITGEKAVQAFLNVYLGLSDLFIIHPEKEMNKGYADLVMEPFLAKYEGINYSFLLELKYVNSGMKPEDPALAQLVREAEDQVRSYALDKKFSKTIGKTKLIKLVLIFSGHEAVYFGDVKD